MGTRNECQHIDFVEVLCRTLKKSNEDSFADFDCSEV